MLSFNRGFESTRKVYRVNVVLRGQYTKLNRYRSPKRAAQVNSQPLGRKPSTVDDATMSKSYWPCRFTLKGRKRYFLWFESKRDGVLLSNKKTIEVFSSKKALRVFAAKNRLKIDENANGSFNLDRLSKWLRSPSGKSINPNRFHEFWNLFYDLAYAVKVSFDSDHKKT